MGYFNYEYSHSTFNINNNDKNPILSEVGIYDWALIIDHKAQRTIAVFQPLCDDSKKATILELLADIESKKAASATKNVKNKNYKVSEFKANVSKQEYLENIKKIKSLILSGDTYQVNYSQEFVADFEGNTAMAYCTLRKSSPSPYSAFLGFDHGEILSLSPEQFISVDDGLAITRPIKGTIAREQETEHDEKNKKELTKSSKNRAENLMIVDLLRNDFSKNCSPHSVKTEMLCALKTFPNVHHLVSKVTGKIKNNIGHLDFLMDCFPGGSITGAPKKRSMEIINKLETHTRGIYCGSIFYLSASGRLDSNISIRTLKVRDDKIHCYGGGGIVADSDPLDEYRESVQKVNHLMATLNS